MLSVVGPDIEAINVMLERFGRELCIWTALWPLQGADQCCGRSLAGVRRLLRGQDQPICLALPGAAYMAGIVVALSKLEDAGGTTFHRT